MEVEHKRPLAAFIVVSAASALLLGQSLVSQAGPSADRTAVAQASSHASRSPSSTGSPANGQAVEGITAAPTYLPVKSIGTAPMLMARGDDGLGIATGAVSDPEGRPSSPNGGVRTRNNDDPSPDPQGTDPTATAGPKPSHGPKPGDGEDDSPGNSDNNSQGPKGNPGPRDDGAVPTPQVPDSHAIPSGSSAGLR